MKSLEIKGSLRGATGKKDSRKLRGSEIVPCVLYGKEETIHFSAPFSEFRGLIYSPDVFRVDLNLDGKVYSAILQATQWHPVDEQLMHADFYQIDDKKPIKIELPVEIVGTAKGIKLGGKLKVNLRKLKVKGLVKDFPDTIKVDVSDLDLSQIIKVGDMKVEGLQFLNAKTAVIVTVTVTRAAKAALSGKEGKK